MHPINPQFQVSPSCHNTIRSAASGDVGTLSIKESEEGKLNQSPMSSVQSVNIVQSVKSQSISPSVSQSMSQCDMAMDGDEDVNDVQCHVNPLVRCMNRYETLETVTVDALMQRAPERDVLSVQCSTQSTDHVTQDLDRSSSTTQPSSSTTQPQRTSDNDSFRTGTRKRMRVHKKSRRPKVSKRLNHLSDSTERIKANIYEHFIDNRNSRDHDVPPLDNEPTVDFVDAARHFDRSYTHSHCTSTRGAHRG